jgi:adenylate cyclase
MSTSTPIKRLFQFNSFWAGVLTAVALVLLFIVGGREIHTLTQALDHRIQDSMFRIRGPVETSGRVVIVDIDEKSLKALGQWPWPRDVFAEILGNIHAAEPVVVGLDIVFAERDRTSPVNYLPIFEDFIDGNPDDVRRSLKDHDAILGEVMGSTRTVVGYFFQIKNDGIEPGASIPFPAWSLSLDDIAEELHPGLDDVLRAHRAVMNVSEVGGMSLTEGFFNSDPDSSGTVRRVPLMVIFNDTLFPSLTFEMLREGLGIERPVPALSPLGVQGVCFGDRFVWTDQGGRICVNFRGEEGAFPHISAVDVLEGRVADEAFRNKYVLVGTSSAGLSDNVATPFSKAFPGVEVHATILDNVLQGDEFRYDVQSNTAIIVTMVLLGGTLLSLVLRYSGPLAGLVVGLLFVVYLTVGNYQLFFLHNRWIGLTFAVGSIVLIYIVSTTFNYFFEGREKRFIRTAFGRYVSPQVVAEMISSPSKLTLEGEEKNLTVLFSDIRGFTTLSESLSPREMRILLNEYLTSMTDIIMDCRGTVDKFIGDAIMAIWNAPLDDANHPENAVDSALQMVSKLHELNPGWIARGFPEIKVGVGINTGLANVGNMGSDSRFDYTVIGDNVNLASRLEGLNKVYGTEILISEATYTEVKNRFFCRLIDNVRVKGKHRPVRIYQPLCEGTGDTAQREAVEGFAKMFDCYEEGRFEEAMKLLENVRFEPGDTLHAVYVERLEHLSENPPETWDGVFVAQSK